MCPISTVHAQQMHQDPYTLPQPRRLGQHTTMSRLVSPQNTLRKPRPGMVPTQEALRMRLRKPAQGGSGYSGHDPREILAAVSKLEDDKLFIAKEGLASPPEPTTLSGSNVTTALLPAGAWLSPAKTPGMMPGPVRYSNQVNEGGGNQYNGDFNIYYGLPETFNGNRSLDTVSSPKGELEIPALPKSGPDIEDVPSRDCESEDAGDTCVGNGGISIALDNDTPACRNEAVDHQTPQYKGVEEHPDVGTQQLVKPSTSGEGSPCDKLLPGLLKDQNVRLVGPHLEGRDAEGQLNRFKTLRKPTAAIYVDDANECLTTIEGIVAHVEHYLFAGCEHNFARALQVYMIRAGGAGAT
ncbi:hypothetical protein CTAM01_16799 [Colletotrichum tamarilloi]|uniref:Uncharacterized protein n=1 Tax=Colletotrichum tamarilloi TaxID=1209934 RepID=A0ABQ9QHI0_9PEZI|nr:uncharacterized protein CTAM01_16799 [Colletotrichum tamarilloi]KAK1470437.1 hypothetical protein CTAM01_16799 [Colletotrichum tamarilloi]